MLLDVCCGIYSIWAHTVSCTEARNVAVCNVRWRCTLYCRYKGYMAASFVVLGNYSTVECGIFESTSWDNAFMLVRGYIFSNTWIDESENQIDKNYHPFGNTNIYLYTQTFNFKDNFWQINDSAPSYAHEFADSAPENTHTKRWSCIRICVSGARLLHIIVFYLLLMCVCVLGRLHHHIVTRRIGLVQPKGRSEARRKWR